MKKILLVLAAISAPLFAGNEGSGGGGIMRIDPGHNLGLNPSFSLPVPIKDLDTLIDAYEVNESVFSFDLDQYVQPVSVSDDLKSVGAVTSSGDKVEFNVIEYTLPPKDFSFRSWRKLQ